MEQREYLSHTETEREKPDVADIQRQYEDGKLVGYTWTTYTGIAAQGNQRKMTGEVFKTFKEAIEDCTQKTGAGPFAPEEIENTPIGGGPLELIAVSGWHNPNIVE